MFSTESPTPHPPSGGRHRGPARSVVWGVVLVLAALAGLIAPMSASAQDGGSSPRTPEWSVEDYNVVGRGGEKAITPEEPEGEERLDRIEKRSVGIGSTSLMDLLGVPTRDVLAESVEKSKAINAQRDKLFDPEKAGGGLAGGLAFIGPDPNEFSEEAEAESDDDRGDTFGLENLRVTSSEYLEVDVQNLRVFGTKRTRIDLGRFSIEADRVQIDVELREAYAAGNVVLADPDSGLKIEAESLTYNFETFRGQAHRVRGQRGEFFLIDDDLSVRPTFEQMNERMVRIDRGGITGNDFPVPTYYVRGRELILVQNERLFLLHATVFVRDWPIAYWPVYTITLNEKSAWSWRVGNNDGRPRELGLWGLLSYDYYYRDIEPDPLDDSRFLRRSFARWSPFVFGSEEIQGVGMDAAYDYNYGQNKGELFAFVVPDDSGRMLEGGEEPEEILGPEGEVLNAVERDTDQDYGTTRFVIDWKHRAELMEDLDLLLKVDWVSDSEIYYDIFDEISEVQEGRKFERSAEAALTLRYDDVLARLRVEEVERITRNRLSVTFEPGDDDLDFDENPDNTMITWPGATRQPEVFEEVQFLTDEEALQDGDRQINNRRFKPVSRRQPELNITTNRIKLSTSPFYWSLDLRAFNNLDKGLNAFDDDDDASVTGGQLYNSITYVMNLNDRVSWQHQLGVGVGHAGRDSDDWGVDKYVGEFPATINNIRFIDESTFLVGEDPVSLNDVEETYVYGDYLSRLTVRFSEELEGNIAYQIREGTDNSLWETYEKIGMVEQRKDVFDYSPYVHRITAGVEYEGMYPRIDLFANVSVNLQSDEDIYANEFRQLASLGGSWTSLDDVWNVSASAIYANSQIRDPSDEFAFEQSSYGVIGQVDWFPAHERYWATVEGSYFETLDEDPAAEQLRAENPDDPFLGEDDDNDDFRYQVTGVYGFKVGPKYEVELQGRYDEDEEDFDRVALVIQRDLYDALALVEFAWELQGDDDDDELTPENEQLDSDDEEFEREFEIGFGFGFKIPNSDRQFGVGRPNTLERRRTAEIELGG